MRLSTCMYSICSLLFPFAWQNIFVPIIPERFLDYVTAPMPFIVGVHTSLMPQVERIPGIEDEVVRPPAPLPFLFRRRREENVHS